ncbi:MAG: ABC transporter ATP-binding protein [Candidatus Omnitrophica bacterium]|nr:ABC transporter ATP-binding protein [Candidatus Omnitrophota bacterium]
MLFGVSLSVKEKEILGLIGPNGSGKSTILKVISGLLTPYRGSIKFLGKEIINLPTEKRGEMGISYFLQGGEVFRNLTVLENLRIGGLGLRKDIFQENMEEVLTLFPFLKKYEHIRAGFLSGGERQALALGIVLMRRPKLLLLDEPSAGLSPLLIKESVKKIREINEKLGVTILLVEQNVKEALKIVHRVYLLKNGKIRSEEKVEGLLEKGKLDELFFR